MQTRYTVCFLNVLGPNISLSDADNLKMYENIYFNVKLFILISGNFQ